MEKGILQYLIPFLLQMGLRAADSSTDQEGTIEGGSATAEAAEVDDGGGAAAAKVNRRQSSIWRRKNACSALEDTLQNHRCDPEGHEMCKTQREVVE